MSDNVLKEKTNGYYIVFFLMVFLSAIETFMLAKDAINYITGAKGVDILASACIITSTVFSFLFIAMLSMNFFTGKQSLSSNVVKMLIVGIISTSLALLANYISHVLIVSKTVSILGTIVALIYIIHLFFVREFKYIPEHKEDDFDEESNFIEDDEKPQNDLQPSSDEEVHNERKRLSNKDVKEKDKTNEETNESLDEDDFL